MRKSRVGVPTLCLGVLALLAGPWALGAEENLGNLEFSQHDPNVPLDETWMSSDEHELMRSGLYSSPLVIPAAAFGADGFNPDSFFFPFGGGYIQGDSSNYGCMMAPVYLPNGVTVGSLWVTAFDNDAAFDLILTVHRVDNFAGGTDTLASVNTIGQFGDPVVLLDNTIDTPLVVYPDYSYYVTTCVQSGNIRVYSVRLYYTTG